MKKFALFAVPVAAGFLAGFLGSQLQGEAIANWYPSLYKSPLTPPNTVFPVVWSILYLLSGISLGIVLRTGRRTAKPAALLFAAQLFLNVLWCFAFFAMRNPAAGLAVILVLMAVLLAYTVLAWRCSKAGAILMVPSILWVGFATYLDGFIWLNN